MALDVLDHVMLSGPAFSEPYVRFELEKALAAKGLLAKTKGEDGRLLQESWDVYRRHLRALGYQAGAIRVRNHVLEPLVERLGYATTEDGGEVETREGAEDGGVLFVAADGTSRLRTWSVGLEEDLDAPARRGAAYRYSHVRVAQRVLLAKGERLGLLTNGVEVRLLISDPARPDSQVAISIDPHWKRTREVPDTYRLILALACPAGVRLLPALVDAARLQQTRVTKELRTQAKDAITAFLQGVLDAPENQERLAARPDREQLARALWREGLIVVYRVLVVLKLESTDDPARSFNFNSTQHWRNIFSPSLALAPKVRAAIEGGETGRVLEHGLRALFRLFASGLQCTEINVQPLGGALFGEDATPILSDLRWPEMAVARLLDKLLWTPAKKGGGARERVHYGPLDVEDLGRVYEALLELEPGIATEPMCRLQRQKLQVVVPAAQGDRYQRSEAVATGEDDGEAGDEDDIEEPDEEAPSRGKKAKVEWIEAIPAGRFFLRVGLGRKSTGSYYTPHSFVRFLVQETLGPQVKERSPAADPRPSELLRLRLLDPAMGSGHFLVEACRFLGAAVYEACRLCDDRAAAAEVRAGKLKGADRDVAAADAAQWRARIAALPGGGEEVAAFLPSRAPEGTSSGYSQRRAEALCRRLVAVHCLYGVDKNPLAVELAKVSLWIEAHAEGLALTFLDHRLVLGDSLTGPFFDHLLTLPGSRRALSDDLRAQSLPETLKRTLAEAQRLVAELEADIGATVGAYNNRVRAKAELDAILAPLRLVAAAWAGGVMLGDEGCDDTAYTQLVRAITRGGEADDLLASNPRLAAMVARGLGLPVGVVGTVPAQRLARRTDAVPALAYELVFPEVLYRDGQRAQGGFDAVLGNPPWDAIQFKTKEFLASFDLDILSAPTKREREGIERRLTSDTRIGTLFNRYKEDFEQLKRANDALYQYQKVEVDGDLAGRQIDAFRVFMERNAQLLGPTGRTGVLVPSAFHANEGATGVRQLYLEKMRLARCFSFENRRKLFEIDSRFKFAAVVADRRGPTTEFPCAFYLQDDEWLFGDRGERELTFTLGLVRQIDPACLTLVECRTGEDLATIRRLYANAQPIGTWLLRTGVTPSTSELPMLGGDVFVSTDTQVATTDDPRQPAVARELLRRGFTALHEGKTFHQFTDVFESRPRYVVRLAGLSDRPRWYSLVRYYRLAYREVARATDERTGIFSVLAPPNASARNAASEITPEKRPTSAALWLCALGNSYVFDYLLRQRVGSHVTRFLLEATPIAPGALGPTCVRFLAHAACRLSANHAGFAAMWREQLSDAWFEVSPRGSWPAVPEGGARTTLRAAVDAVVAHAYGLDEQSFAQVLASFTHSTTPDAPSATIHLFRELTRHGLAAFVRTHDPYWEIPLNESLPEPVIDLPVAAPAPTAGQQLHLLDVGIESQLRLPLPTATHQVAERPMPAFRGDADPTAYERVRAHLSEHGVITSTDAQTLLGTDAAAVRPLMERLVAEGLAVKEGQRRGTRYRRAGPAASSTETER